MRLIAILPMMCFVAALATVGVRLLLLAKRTRELPEASIGGGLVLMGLVGQPLAALGRIPGNVGTPLGEVSFVLGVSALHLGAALLFVFTWSVFRRSDRSGAMILGIAFASLLVAGAGLSWHGIGETDLQKILPRTRPWGLFTIFLVALAFLWSGLESTRYYLQLRRRLALGLSDPVVTNRFALWGVVGIATSTMCLGIAGCLALGMTVAVDPIPLALMTVMGSFSGIAFWLSFVPPKRYVAAIQMRHERALNAADHS